jgi:hypothetical protein
MVKVFGMHQKKNVFSVMESLKVKVVAMRALSHWVALQLAIVNVKQPAILSVLAQNAMMQQMALTFLLPMELGFVIIVILLALLRLRRLRHHRHLLLVIARQIVPVPVLELTAQAVDVTAVLSLAAEPAMINALKTVNALLVLSATFLFYSKELLIFSRLI